MRVILVSVHYHPLRTSAAVQMRDLAFALKAQGHDVLVVTPSEGLAEEFQEDSDDGVAVLRVRTPVNSANGYTRRLLLEMQLPFRMWSAFARSKYNNASYDLVAWYSPTIFFGYFIYRLKRLFGLKAYLILRDIFPEWANDLGILRKGPAYYFLKLVAEVQYRAADVIGVQSRSNLAYVARLETSKRKVEVFNNWLTPNELAACSIDLRSGPLSGRRIFVYTGNIGVAQNADIFVDVGREVIDDSSIGFVFVGRGDGYDNLKKRVAALGLNNFQIYDEIPSIEIPSLLRQCSVGLVALHPKHETHNIPGKFVSYMHAGLPVLARVNANNDLVTMIEENRVGRAYCGSDPNELANIVRDLARSVDDLNAMSMNCLKLADSSFSSDAAAEQLTSVFQLDRT